MRNRKDLMYIFSNGRLAALNKKDGEILWEVNVQKIIGASMSYNIGQFFQEDDKLYLGISGKMFCFSAKDGELVWKNELKGWGYYFVHIANQNNDAAAFASSSTNTAQAATATTNAAVVAATSSS